ncbi:cytochrome P450 [Agrobacterium rhizogenes]|uniref:cytochrome P450 n=1 Tax=Rhizobium rhizogenes TaxID=359 RepID=UPI0015736C7E|nr:cytochrome P450 [Rhizobium rhizogenes]NTG51719.1 cytochrome P450 [Rhizobium rhizogenes]
MKIDAAVSNTSLETGDGYDTDSIETSLREIVVDPGRPRAYPNFSTKLSHIPGKSGFFSAISTAMAMSRDGIDYFVKQREVYGDIYRDQLGSHQAVVVTNPDMIGSILRNEDKAWSSGMAIGKIAEGLSLDVPAYRRRYLLGLDFEHHHSARKLVQHAFSRIALHGYLSIIQNSFNEDIQKWRLHKKVGFKKEIHHILSKLSSRLFLGIYDKSESNRILDTTDAYWKALMSIIKSPAINPKRRRAIELKRALRSQVLSLLPARRERPGTDFLSYLCNLEERPEEWDDEQLIDLLFGVIFPSFDTTALALSSMFYLLATYPEWQERVRSEVLSLPEGVSLDDLLKMDVTEWVWKETLRLYPVSPALQRASLRTQLLAEHKIPAATLVTLSIGQLGFLPEYWESPKRFDPERFSPQRAEDRGHKYIYMPFGHGPHRCIGAQLSSIEMKLLCIAILKRYRIELENPYVAKHQLSPLGSVSGDVELKLSRL